jgi:quinol monooxygenase YgiN
MARPLLYRAEEHQTFQRVDALTFEARGYGVVARVRMTVEWFVPLGQARPITQALHTMMVDTRRSHGCIGCSLSTGIRDQGIVRYTEEWESEEDLRRRLEGSSFSNLSNEGLTRDRRN